MGNIVAVKISQVKFKKDLVFYISRALPLTTIWPLSHGRGQGIETCPGC